MHVWTCVQGCSDDYHGPRRGAWCRVKGLRIKRCAMQIVTHGRRERFCLERVSSLFTFVSTVFSLIHSWNPVPEESMVIRGAERASDGLS